MHNECINRYQENLRTYINTRKLNNPLLNEQMGHWRNKKGNLNIPRIKWIRMQSSRTSDRQPRQSWEENSKLEVFMLKKKKKSERSQKNNLLMCPKVLEKQEQAKLNCSRLKRITRFGADINEKQIQNNT